jgi:hypothetical protein
MAKVKVWFVEFPTFQYNEDVVALAKKNDLIIIDARFKGDALYEEAPSVPKLTKKGAVKADK